MKVVFEVIKEKSGANVWTERLCSRLNRENIQCSIQYHSFFYQVFPVRVNYLLRNSEHCIQHTNSWNGWAFKSRNPLVVTQHTAIFDSSLNQYKSQQQRMYHSFIKRYESRSLTASDCVTCVSNHVKKYLETTYDWTDSVLIPNGIDTEVFQPSSKPQRIRGIDREKTVLLFVGNLTRMKGADLLPEIMENLGDKYILYVTSGFKHNVEIPHKNIICIGTLDQKSLVDAYNSCDIFLAPTRHEGFGLSIAEAMSCGKPVVATNCSAIPELIISERGGFLCEMDKVQDFTEKIRYLAADEELMRKMGAFNRQRVLERFTLEKMTGEYLRLYNSLSV